MRLIVDTLIAAMLVGLLAAMLWHYRAQNQDVDSVRRVHDSLAQMQEQMLYHKAMEEARNGGEKATVAVSPEWFSGHLPDNPFVPGRQPWLDVAPAGDTGTHPPDPVVTSPTQASFWYNPALGLFRARVTPQYSDEATLALYNKLNFYPLGELPATPDPARAPRPLYVDHGVADSSDSGSMHAAPDADPMSRERLLSRPSLLSSPH